ncbi:hypothetical protein PG995_007844 [Apiospora arundinis]
MVFEFLRNLLWFIDRCYDPMRDRDGTYNSVHLQISEWGLRVQNILHIPPKYGLFFPGPPQLRALEADSFIIKQRSPDYEWPQPGKLRVD